MHESEDSRKPAQAIGFVNGMACVAPARSALGLGVSLVRSAPAAALSAAITARSSVASRPATSCRQFNVIPQYSGLRLADRLFRPDVSERLFAAARAGRAARSISQDAASGSIRAQADAVSTPSSPSPAASSGASSAEGATYPFTEVEKRWQQYWLENKTFRTPEKPDTSKPKFYVLDMFPYPSGAGLHVGHPEGYTATDIVARYKRMRGYNVMHPMGWDAFGLPAEQYALETGTHPRVTTAKNVGRFRQQLQALGFSYDWEREVSTTDAAYYKWTQWIFLRLYERGLAYQAEVPVNWCPALGTVLANEEVIDGKSERGGHPVIRKPMRQWILKITEYAERLLEDLDEVDWPDNVKEMQRNWIGKSEGAELDFEIQGTKGAKKLRVFTTRPDTLFGATYMVMAPEHPLVAEIVSKEQKAAVEEYVKQAATKSDLERTELQKDKSGVFTGAYAVNPVTEEAIPVYVADYVLATYGTGAIMAVPAHDKRDHEFARKYKLPIRQVVAPASGAKVEVEKEAFVTSDEGALAINSANAKTLSIDGLPVPKAKEAVCAWLAERGLGGRRVNYKLRDWLFSRQRYWGEPFPIVFVDGKPVPLPDEALPVTLPEVESYKPSGTGESPLATVPEWVNTELDGRPAARETNTMPQWAGSCWYYLRFLDPTNEAAAVAPDLEKYWMPVDLYVGGVEHAVLHLLYARFWHKVLYDCGVVTSKEPFQRLVNQGMILGEVEYTLYRDAQGRPVSADEAEERDDCTPERIAPADVEKVGEGFVLKGEKGVRVAARAHKMSKSRGNVVNPDHVVAEYGADSLRLYEMFMGPLEQVKTWSMKGVEGVFRFLNRTWRLYMEGGALSPRVAEAEPTREQLRLLHQTIKKVTEEIDSMRFNTGISAMMEFVNAATKWETRPRAVMQPFVLLLAPYAPHIAEELWHALGNKGSLAYAPWPEVDEQYLQADTINVVVQVNGKLRAQLQVSPTAGKEEVLAAAKAEPNVAKFLDGKAIKKEVFVPGKLVNFVAA
eukprot:tig00000865_g5102.t1